MPSSYASEVGRFRSRDADVEAAVAPADDGTRRTAWRGVAARVTRISYCAQCDTKRATAPERKKRTISASRKGKRRAAAVRATACGAGVRHRGRRTRDRGACQRGGTRARSAMSALSALEKRLTALVPTTWTDASAPPDQRSLFELLAETAATTLRSSSAEVKEAQRSLEDVMLRVTCGGWAGPAVRVTAANVLANLFFVGNEVALYSCVNELVAVAFADDDAFATDLPGFDDEVDADDSGKALARKPSPDCVSIACTTSMPLSHKRFKVSSTNVSGSTCALSMAALDTPFVSRYDRSLSCQLPSPSRTLENAPCDHKSPSVT